jgi:ParB-like chromosome segregation protein Spo0J
VSETGGERIPSRLGPKQIPLDDLLPHPLNSNAMSPEYKDKLVAHVRRTGRYPFLVVRPHPTEPGKYQVLDGHHRVSVLRELGHAEARCDVWDVDDRESKLLLATLNRLEGQDLPLRRAQLLHELLGEWSAPDLGGLLPETEAEILDLHSLLEFPAEEIAEQLAAEADEEEKTLPVVIHFVVSHEQAELIDSAIERASDGTAGRDRKARGLANLAKHYLEGGVHAAG